MDETITRLIESGAVSHLCIHHARVSGLDGDWGLTHSYALRTFPRLGSETIARLIAVCQIACSNAATFRRPGSKKPCGV